MDMTDIVERLQRKAESPDLFALMVEAADEIERLREVLRIADISINPPDRGGISLAIWNARLAGATSAIRAALKGDWE
jgi:hypothetical protein